MFDKRRDKYGQVPACVPSFLFVQYSLYFDFEDLTKEMVFGTGPFVTTVGGTIRTNPEVAVSFSGGGFSNYFAQPSYQTDAVSAFLTRLGSTNAGLFKYVCFICASVVLPGY